MRGCNCSTVNKDAHAPGCLGSGGEFHSLTAVLRDEVERLKAENAALLNAFPEYASTGHELREERARTEKAERERDVLLKELKAIWEISASGGSVADDTDWAAVHRAIATAEGTR